MICTYIMPQWSLDLLATGLLCLFSAIQIFYYLFFYFRIIRKREIGNEKRGSVPVSVVICSRNSVDYLKAHLPLILQQDYTEFEVVVVNDGSDDDTEAFLIRYAADHPRLKITSITPNEKFGRRKKLALTIGIKAAKHELLVLTDADCWPVGKTWISSMVAGIAGEREIVLGYGGYASEKGLLNKLIRFETMFIGMQYITFALTGRPYMGIGRNLVYKKSLFFDHKGFASHLHLESGDDDLFINEVATKKNTTVCYHPDSHTRSIPCKTFSEWARQKRRHLTTGPYYKSIHKVLLSMELISRTFLYLSFIATIYFNAHWIVSVSAFGVRIICFFLVTLQGAKRLHEKDLWSYVLIFDFVLPYLYLIFGIQNFIRSRQRKWK